MASLTATIKTLLTKNESTTLDFKRDQYPLTTPEQKSELLKDLLAFANTPRHQDAYLLIGITEGHPATITGITHHLTDHELQQFVHSKTNRPLTFSYHALTINGHQLAAIIIPPQQRPIFLKKAYGRLPANTVYLRRGSSTSIATPDDIAQMQATVPTLHLTFADLTERRVKSTRRQLTSTTLRTPQAVPDQTAKIDILNGLFNPDYYRELLHYAAFHARHKPVGIAITNASNVTAYDVRITLTIPDPKRDVLIALDAPAPPERLATSKPKSKPPKHFFTIHRTRQAWQLTTRIPKVQPHTTDYVPTPFYLGAKRTITLTITATIAADNLPAPLTKALFVRITSRKQTMTLRAALKRYTH